MKKYRFLIALALTIGLTSVQAQKATLSGTLTGVPDGVYVTVSAVVGSQLQFVDTLRLNNKGAFRMELEVPNPTLYILQTSIRDGSICHLMVEPKESVTANLTYQPDQRRFMVTSCKGSKNVEVYRQFNDILRGAVNPTLQATVPHQVEQLLKTHKNVLISAFLVTFFEQEIESYAGLYTEIRDALAPTYPNDPFVMHLSDKLRGVLGAGMEAPEISMTDPEGKTRRLSDLRGKIVLIDFWASWCGPCRRENPNVVKLYEKYHAKGFEVFSVSLDKTHAAWVKAIKDDHLVWPNHVSDLNGWTSSAGAAYGIMSVPSTVLVDKQGRIIARNLRGPELEQAVAAALGE